MDKKSLNRLAHCEDAMKQARWAIALQLRRWRDGDEINAVAELQNAHDALVDLVGEAKMQERTNPHAAALGKLGGKAKSAAKTATARENGRKGGRPKRTTLPLTTREQAERLARKNLGK